jgi:S-adenosylmethionine-diacylglycerol 3-amino-3-carboxypropyl transferase
VRSEAAGRADFSQIRYAQCWEDADVLLEALDIQPGDSCLSIASAGDNALAMASRGPRRVVALDLSDAQLACLELRVAAYRALSHPELLQLIGSSGEGGDMSLEPAAAGAGAPVTPSAARARAGLYARCAGLLSPAARAFWDAHPAEIAGGIGGAGKFERYFRKFRERVVPLIHHRRTVEALLAGGDCETRRTFYERRWNTVRWRLLFKVFFSRWVMGRLGRDPAFFRYVEGSIADRILARTRHALTVLDPAENPYLQWILTGRHTTALPYALRPENFEAIRAGLGSLEIRCQSVEEFLESEEAGTLDRANLSDIFEYMSEENSGALLERLADAARPGARLAYWNMLAPRRRPERLAHRLRPLVPLAERLHRQDKAFFYSAFVVEEVV